VGLLGGAAPAVKGLTTLSPTALAHAEGVAEYTAAFISCRNQTEQGAPAMTDPTPQPADELAAMKARLDELMAQNASLKASAEGAAAALAQHKREAAHAEHAAFADSLVQAGKLTPALAKTIVATLDHLAETPALQFAEGNKTQPLHQAVREALAALPATIPMGEAAADHSEVKVKPIAQMSGHEAAALYKRDPQAFRRAAGMTE